jgi:hypothetical protein
MGRIKKNPTPFYVINRSFYNRDRFEPYNIMTYLIETYKETKKNKWRTTPQTFEEFKSFVIDASRYQFWGRCEYELLLAHWPFGSYKMRQEMKKFIATNPNLDDHSTDIDFCNIITSDMEKIDVYWQIKMNLDVITKLLMENLGIVEGKPKKKTKKDEQNKEA